MRRDEKVRGRGMRAVPQRMRAVPQRMTGMRGRVAKHPQMECPQTAGQLMAGRLTVGQLEELSGLIGHLVMDQPTMAGLQKTDILTRTAGQMMFLPRPNAQLSPLLHSCSSWQFQHTSFRFSAVSSYLEQNVLFTKFH